MNQAIEAVYENGVFRPLNAGTVPFSEGQRVQITVIEPELPESFRVGLEVFEGLTTQEIEDVKKIALDRSTFFGSQDSE